MVTEANEAMELSMKTLAITTSIVALSVFGTPAFAQTTTADQPQSRQQESIGSIFSTLFGDRIGTGTIEAQWAIGRTPLANQKVQFETKVDAEVRAGAINQTTGTRLKTDYAELVQLEARYGADRRFTTQERSDLSDRYGKLTQALVDKSYGDDEQIGEVAKGKAEFDRRVDASVSARRISRVEGSRLKADYAALADVEISYLRDGTLSARERDDLDTRLDALDTRVGDTAYGSGSATQTPRSRLDAIAKALPASGLSAAAKTQLQVEHGDILRLEAAYARISPTADERSYLERRISELETRARVKK